MAISDFFADTDRLDKVDWEIMKATYRADTVEDNERSRRRLAEFLVHAFLPWKLVSGIGVINSAIADEVREAIARNMFGQRGSGSERRVGYC
jgi:hypothetical protein